MTSLHVYVVHWNAPDKADRTIRSLLASNGVDLSVTVIDNGSLRSSPHSLPARCQWIALARNIGFAAAANRALADARGRGLEFVAIASHDVEVAPNGLSQLLETLQSHPSLGAVGPLFYDSAGLNILSAGGVFRKGKAIHSTDVGQRGRAGLHELPVEWLHGALTVFRLSALDDVGGYDERLFSYCEDVDLGLRLRDRGWGVALVPRATACESGPTTTTYWHNFLIARNELLLLGWRQGRTRLWWRSVGVLAHALKALAASLLPTRPLSRRARSRVFARSRAAAGICALRGKVGKPLALESDQQHLS